MSKINKDGSDRKLTEGWKKGERERNATPAHHARRLKAVAKERGQPVEKITNGHGNV